MREDWVSDMPSKDSFHEKNPKLNEGIDKSSDPERPRGKEQRAMSAQVQRLARRLGKDPDEIAKKIPADTLRRTKYPVLESVTEDGKRSFKHDIGVMEGPKSLLRQ